jgi:hypothetical protein
LKIQAVYREALGAAFRRRTGRVGSDDQSLPKCAERFSFLVKFDALLRPMGNRIR